jgi:predicted DNA-binding protein with PD1-like motif
MDDEIYMNYKRFDNKVVVRIDKGEEIVDQLKTICKKLDIKLGSIIGIGATDKVMISLLNTKTKKYQSKEFTGDHEIAPLVGNITMMNGEVFLHLHVTICNVEHKALGGHLTSAVISATFEGVIDIIDGQITRDYNDDIGLNLLSLK